MLTEMDVPQDPLSQHRYFKACITLSRHDNSNFSQLYLNDVRMFVGKSAFDITLIQLSNVIDAYSVFLVSPTRWQDRFIM